MKLLSLFLFLCLKSCSPSEPVGFWSSIPEPLGWVNDFEHLFTQKQLKSLDKLLSDNERKTSNEIAVITIPSNAVSKVNFDSTVLEIAKAWGIGKKVKNNGILIGISKGHRLIRICNADGITKLLSDSETKLIIETVFIPNFKKEDYFLGTFSGIQSLIKTIDKNRILKEIEK
ncbi:MAG: TPM domain-containing protein [Bacteroidia bacterium]